MSPTPASSLTAPPPEPDAPRRTGRRALIVLAGLLGTVVIIAAGWLFATKQVDTAGASGTFLAAVPAVEITSVPSNGATDVRPDAAVNVTTKFGRIVSAAILDDAGRPINGVLSPDGSAWSTAGAGLAPGAHYRVVLKVDTARGVSTRVSQFTTLTPTNTVSAKVSPGDNQTVGVGQPIIVRFDAPVTNKAAVEQRLSVADSTPVVGAWHWFGDKEVHYRPSDYWPADTSVTVTANLAGVDLGNGAWGGRNITTNFKIGASHVTTVDANTHEMTVTANGAVVRVIPVSTGRSDLPTMGGTLITLDKAPSVVMDSSTNGIPVNSPDGYRETVLWNVRITNSGIYVHAAPWSVGSQGQANVSHGCVNASVEAAQWFFDFSQAGDIVKVVNTPRPPSPTDAGSRDWNMTWDQWVSGSALTPLPIG